MTHRQTEGWTPGIFPSTFIQLVNGSKNSILNSVMKLNLFMCIFSKKPLKIFPLYPPTRLTLKLRGGWGEGVEGGCTLSNPLNQKIKNNKNCLHCMERALFILFYLKKSVQKENSPDNKTCVCSRHLLLLHFFGIKLWCRFSKQSTFETRPSTLALLEVLKKSIRSKHISRVFLLFDIKVKVRRNPVTRLHKV